MLFKYKIKLEVEVEFDAPLLGADTTILRRRHANKIAKDALNEMIRTNTTSFTQISKEIKEDNLNGKVSGEIQMGSANPKK